MRSSTRMGRPARAINVDLTSGPVAGGRALSLSARSPMQTTPARSGGNESSVRRKQTLQFGAVPASARFGSPEVALIGLR